MLAKICLLGGKGWLHKEYTVLDAKGEPRWGLCFAYLTRIQILRKRGYFTQFDSTHKTNTSELEAFFSYVNWENVFTSSFTLSMIWWKKIVLREQNTGRLWRIGWVL